MINPSDQAVIVRTAQKYNVATVFLFGSSLSEDERARDIDLGVKGINPAVFFKFYSELMRQLSKPVDVVDLSEPSRFNALVEKRGVKIYG